MGRYSYKARAHDLEDKLREMRDELDEVLDDVEDDDGEADQY